MGRKQNRIKKRRWKENQRLAQIKLRNFCRKLNLDPDYKKMMLIYSMSAPVGAVWPA